MICPGCGMEYDAKDGYCPACGNPTKDPFSPGSKHSSGAGAGDAGCSTVIPIVMIVIVILWMLLEYWS